MSDTTTANPTVEIDNPATLVELVRDCESRETAIVDYGIAHGGLGYPPPAEHVRLVQHGSVIEHYERDLTVRAAAGTTMGKLQETLQPHNQFLPIDADDDLTLGEVINHNMYGPLRVAYGSTRELILGLRFVDGRGRDIHVGGRTVKNVAGYDMSRFMVGSLGEMGPVYEATLRTCAIPSQAIGVELSINNPDELDSILPDWLLTDAAPGAMTMIRSDSGWQLHFGYFGTSRSCEVQLTSLETRLRSDENLDIVTRSRHALAEHLDQTAGRRAWRREDAAVVKVIVPPAHTGRACNALANGFADTSSLRIEALPVHGCIFAGGRLDATQAQALDKLINGTIEPVGGLRTWVNRPNGAKSIEPFAPPQLDRPMLDRLKRTLDPKYLFNPGRFLARPETDP